MLSRGDPKGASSLKHLGRLRVVPLKLQGLNPERGLALGQLGSSQFKSFELTLGVGLERLPNQPGADSAFSHVTRL